MNRPVQTIPQDTQPRSVTEEHDAHPQLRDALGKLGAARDQLLSAAIAFCDGQISSGQLKAVREILREHEELVAGLRSRAVGSRDVESATPRPDRIKRPAKRETEAVQESPRVQTPTPTTGQLPALPELKGEIRKKLEDLESKLEQVKLALKAGKINRTQYEAIRKHYLSQREVALRLHELHPESDRWRVVLEEGKTTFLMKLNEASCSCVALFDIETRELLFVEGTLPEMAAEAVSFLRTFRSAKDEESMNRMYATHTDDDRTLVLIPGQYSAALVDFSEDPPSWQVGALREVHRNFELANRLALERGERKRLIFPNLNRFTRS